MTDTFWCERAWVGGAVRDGVLLRTDSAGILTEVCTDVPAAEVVAGSAAQAQGRSAGSGAQAQVQSAGSGAQAQSRSAGSVARAQVQSAGSGAQAQSRSAGSVAAEVPAGSRDAVPAESRGGESVRRVPGIVFPGGVNAHSHAFHRLLRGRTHADGGTFWTWREVMYDMAARLTPESYRVVARAVFAEMLAGGWTSVGEFHYVHHAPGGQPYGEASQEPHDHSAKESPDHGDSEPHAMELALAAAAEDVGIRMRLLDTCYLTGAIGEELSPEQARFGDGDIDGYLQRHASLARALEDRVAGSPGTGYRSDGRVSAGVLRTGNPSPAAWVSLGAAIHSVRAVPADAIARFAELDGPVHIHLSEQPAENDACVAAYGQTPTGVLKDAGVLSPALSPVHATHLTDADIAALGSAGTTIVMCPSTEADLADGIGPALELADAGATIALGSDQHVVLDALRELQGLEAGERLRSGVRGRFTPAQLIEAMTSGGARSLDLPTGALEVGRACDFIALDPVSPRTYGSVGEQVVLAGTSADVRTVVTAGRVRVRDGVHEDLGNVSALYREAYAALGIDS